MTIKRNVFCIKCRYYTVEYWENPVCLHPSNLRHKQNWLLEHYKPIKSPRKLNKHNNCANFEPKTEQPVTATHTIIK